MKLPPNHRGCWVTGCEGKFMPPLLPFCHTHWWMMSKEQRLQIRNTRVMTKTSVSWLTEDEQMVRDIADTLAEKP